MNDLFKYDRLTPNRVRKIAETIGRDLESAREFAEVTLERLARLIPDRGMVKIDRIEQAFIVALETRKIFESTKLDIWSFFPRKDLRSLLGHVFIRAVEGSSLRDIVGAARSSAQGRSGELLFDARENFSEDARQDRQAPVARPMAPRDNAPKRLSGST